MSNKFIISPHICSGYSYFTTTKTLRIKDLSSDVKKELNAAMNNKMISRVVTKIKPTWLVYLNDIMSGNFNNEFKSCKDYESVSTLASAVYDSMKRCNPLSENQSYVLECAEGTFRLKIETVVKTDDKVTDRTRAAGPDGLNNAIRAYIHYVFPRFLPTLVSSFLKTLQVGKIDQSSIDDNDHQFGDFLKFNCDSGICMTKDDFLTNCHPIDFYYAITYHRSPALNPHTLQSLILLSRVAPTIGQNLQSQEAFLGKHETIGSKAIIVGSDGVVRRFSFESSNNGRFGCTFRLTITSVSDKLDLSDVLDELFKNEVKISDEPDSSTSKSSDTLDDLKQAC